jgi:pantothenate kinase type III
MIVFDVGNTDTVVGFFQGKNLIKRYPSSYYVCAMNIINNDCTEEEESQ